MQVSEDLSTQIRPLTGSSGRVDEQATMRAAFVGATLLVNVSCQRIPGAVSIRRR
jgi:hypothetical protein